MLYEILKDTRAFRELAKEGLQQGLEQGLEMGRVDGLRLAVLDMIETRFADHALVETVRIQVNAIGDEQTLRRLVGAVAILQQPEELASLIEQCIKGMPQASVSKRKTRKVQAPKIAAE